MNRIKPNIRNDSMSSSSSSSSNESGNSSDCSVISHHSYENRRHKRKRKYKSKSKRKRKQRKTEKQKSPRKRKKTKHDRMEEDEVDEEDRDWKREKKRRTKHDRKRKRKKRSKQLDKTESILNSTAQIKKHEPSETIHNYDPITNNSNNMAIHNHPKKDKDSLTTTTHPISTIEKSKQMIPMTQEQYKAQQAIIREVYDPESGRMRLVRGTGEIIERIVRKEDHLRINQIATRTDSWSYTRSMMNHIHKR